MCGKSEQLLTYLPLRVDYLAELAALCQTLLGLSLSQERHLAIHSPLTYIFHLKYHMISFYLLHLVLLAVLLSFCLSIITHLMLLQIHSKV